MPRRGGVNRPGDFPGGAAGIAALVNDSGGRGVEAQPVDAIALGVGVNPGEAELARPFADAGDHILAKRDYLAVTGEDQPIPVHAGRLDRAVEVDVHPVFAFLHAVDDDFLHAGDGNAVVCGRALHPHRLLADLPGGAFPVADAGGLDGQDVEAVLHGQRAQVADAVLVDFVDIVLGHDRKGQALQVLLADQPSLPAQGHVRRSERIKADAVAEEHIDVRQRRGHDITVNAAEADDLQGDLRLLPQRDHVVVCASAREIVKQVQARLVDRVAAVRQGTVSQPAVAEWDVLGAAGGADDLIASEDLLRDVDVEPGTAAIGRDRERIRRRVGRVFRAGRESLAADRAGVVHRDGRRLGAVGEIPAYPEGVWCILRVGDIVDQEGGVALEVLPGAMQLMDVDAVNQADVRVAVAGQVRIGSAHADEVPLQRRGHPPLRQAMPASLDGA